MADVSLGRFLGSIDRRPFLWAAALICLTTAIRAAFIAWGPLDLVQDEAQYWDWSRRPQLSYYSKGPLIAWIIALWTSIFGTDEFGVRFGALLNGFIIQWIIWFGCAVLFRRPRMGVLAVLAACGVPLFQAVCMLMTTDDPLLVCWLIALFSLYRTALHPEEKLPLALLFLSMAVGNLAKYMMLFMLAVALFFGLLLMHRRLMQPKHLLRVLLIMTGGSALGYLPILIWNIQNGWVTFRHVAALAGITGSRPAFFRFDTPFEFFGSSLGIMLPWWLIAMLCAGFAALLHAWKGRDAAFDALCLKEGHSGAAADGTAQTVRNALFASAFLPMWIGLFLWSFHTRVYPNWAGMSYAAGFLLIADLLDKVMASGMHRRIRACDLALKGNLVLFVLLFAFLLLPLPNRWDPAGRLKGWEAMGNEMGMLLEKFPDKNKVFFLTDYYDVTAEVAFYGPGRPTAYLADIGTRRRTQYDLWPTPVSEGNDLRGWDCIFVTRNAEVPAEIFTMFEHADVIPFSPAQKGLPGRDCVFALLRGFNGHWPKTSYEHY